MRTTIPNPSTSVEMPSAPLVQSAFPPSPQPIQKAELTVTKAKKKLLKRQKTTAKIRLRLAEQSAFAAMSLAAGARKRHQRQVSRERAGTNFERMKISENTEISTFKMQEFLFTFLCEFLPNIFVSPIIVLLAKGWRRGISVIGHRKYFPIPGYEDNQSYIGHILSVLVFALPQWGFYVAAYLFCRYPEELSEDLVDGIEMMVCGSLLLVRSMVISIKYAHFKPENLKRMEMGTEYWNQDDSDTAMMLAGWGGKPRKLKGVLQRCIDHGMGITDVDLSKVNFHVYDSDAKFGAGGVEMDALSVLSRIITSQFGARFFDHPYFPKLSVGGSVLISCVGPISRAYYGVAVFGNHWASTYCCVIFTIFGTIYGIFTLLLLFSCSFDFYRRLKAAKMLTSLVTLPGLEVSEFMSNQSNEEDDILVPSDTIYNSQVGPKDQDSFVRQNSSTKNKLDALKDSKYIYFDMRNSDNGFAWMLTRRCLRKCGEPYFERCQIFNAFYLLTACAAIAMANSLVWTGNPHTMLGLILLVTYAFVLTTGFLTTAYFAAELQAMVNKDRLSLKRDLFLISRELIDVNAEKAITARNVDRDHNGLLDWNELDDYEASLRESKEFMEASETLIDFEEEQHDPVSLLSMKADYMVFNTIIGALLGAMFFAYEGYTNNGGSYSDHGRFVSAD